MSFPDCRSHRAGPSRPCIHVIGPIPPLIRVDAAAAARLTWQPVIAGNIIASRVGDTLTLAADALGPHRDNKPHYPESGAFNPRLRWHYRLHGDGPVLTGELIADATEGDAL